MANEYIDRWRLNKPDQLENSGDDQSDEEKSKQETLYPYKQVTAEMQQEMKKNGVDWNMPPNKQKTAEAKIKAQQYSDRAYGRSPNNITKLKLAEKYSRKNDNKATVKSSIDPVKNLNLYALAETAKDMSRGVIDGSKEVINEISATTMTLSKTRSDKEAKNDNQSFKRPA